MGTTFVPARRTCWVLTPTVECFPELGEAGSGPEQSDPEVEILGPPQLAPAAGRLERRAPDHGGSVCERTVDQQFALHRLVFEQRVVPCGPAAHPGAGCRAGEKPEPRPEHVHAGVSVEPGELAGEPLAVGDVVGVVPRDPRRAGE